ncbi:Tn3 family transposase [Planomonospora corallina]|uniref:Tn3 family transposase n=1 Tax=Planomonospora corallina TaxID=1806052 RepID=A0ABV8IFJ0_9ACTN
MPVEFLSDEQAAAHGRFTSAPTRTELERHFFLDDADRRLVAKRRGDHNRLGFALQLVTVRFVGAFLADPVDVPIGVVDYVADQLDIADASCVKQYAQRAGTHREHAGEIRRAYGLRDFAEAEDALAVWVTDRAWTTGDGPTAIFTDATAWLREHGVLLPGVSTLARLVARVRQETYERLWQLLHDLLSTQQRLILNVLLEVPPGARVSELERLRKGSTKASGPAMVKALERVVEIASVGMGGIDTSAIPPRRLAELARYGLTGKAPAIKRHPPVRRLATLLATVQVLEAKAIDDALELLDVLMTGQLLARAERESAKEKLRTYPRFSRASATLALAVEVLLEASEYGEDLTLEQVWESIDAVVPRGQLRAAVEAVTDAAPPPDADPDGQWRALLTEKIAVVRSFLPLLTSAIAFGATAEGEPALEAMRALPTLINRAGRRKIKAAYLPADGIAEEVVTGEWKRLVHRKDLPEGLVDRAAYVFCVLEKFHRLLRRRDIYALGSSRWSDPRAHLLAGQAWQAAKGPVLNTLGLPEDPEPLLAAHAAALDEAYTDVAGRLTDQTAVSVDAEGRLHLAHLEAVEEPPGLIDLRKRLQGMLPRVDLPELILEVMSWRPGFTAAFTPVSGGAARLESDLHVTIAACLTAHALNITYAPIISPGVAALTRDRISHVDQTYLRPETYSPANASLIEGQAGIGLAQAWGGGLVAAIDGVRFVVPVPTICARPNPKYFGRRRGAQWLNMINDQGVGLGAKVLSGTPRDSLHVIDVLYGRDGGRAPEVIITDAGSYSDIVFALIHLLGRKFRPVLADLPDHKLWRFDPGADYGPLNTAARGKIDTVAIRRHWDDILRIVASIHTGAVRAHDVIRMLQREGHPTPLGNALAHYGRIFKSLHVLTYVDDEPYRRDIKAMRNLQEGRHDLAKHLFHGRKGELRHAYQTGMEDQLGALGLVLNCVVLWNTVYLDTALQTLRAQGHHVADEDVVRLSPFMRRHINVHGHYSFHLPDLGGGRRALRDPDAADTEES